MFMNVLVGVDGTLHGRDAIALASRLTDPDGRLTLAHVHGGELHRSNATTAGVIAEERAASTELLARERTAAHVDAELISIAAMSPGRALHEQAEKQRADLLVVGSCRHGALGRAMLGDDTRAALNGAPCAVAIASTGYADDRAPIAKVGVGYDDSPESRAALAMAHELAAPTGAAVHALEVVSLPTYVYGGVVAPALGESIDAMLEEASIRMKTLPDVVGHAAYGLTGEELAAFGDEVDILVVGSRGYGPVKRLMLGSTSDYLERHARCPLLVLPRAALSDSENEAEPSSETTVGTSA